MRGNSHTRNSHTNKKGRLIPPFFHFNQCQAGRTKDRLKNCRFVIPEKWESNSSSPF
jgi:hypothetical protein